MQKKRNELLSSPEVQSLVTLIEEAARSTDEGVRRFIEPAQGTLRRATSKRHHLIFGRRGSGKSSLLRKAAADLTISRRPIAYIDLEAFKAHAYPDVLLSILIKTFTEFETWLRTAALHPANKTSFWDRLFGSKPTTPAYDKKEVSALAEELKQQIATLTHQLHSADDTATETVAKTQQSASTGKSFDVGLERGPFRGKFQSSDKDESKVSLESRESSRRSKTDFLHRNIMEYQRLFQSLGTICKGDSYLFLDDAYHLKKADQPWIIDYFHRLAKGNKLWVKIGTIKHRSRWYVNGDPPVGLKTSDDADEIDLDLTLEKYEITKEFLRQVLESFVKDCPPLTVNKLLNDGALDRLVLASGGVARDFLAIFRRAVDVARERGDNYRGERIGSEDVNIASGEHEPSKREELKRDTLDDQVEIVHEFEKIVKFCVEDAAANVFLFASDDASKEFDLIQELVDLRLIHLVRSRVTLRGRSGELFQSYMLDLSQYAGSRKRRNLEIVNFWEDADADKLRRSKLVYSPTTVQVPDSE